ncbi:hypothetical protein [Halorussus marinus]|uniref:hypothetical protein n=1 Tax=Halorussus marinus TaxID=2505976 RepID=UPI001091E32D|nr:hypothetical protein [Halorussus marinus]
MRNRLQQVFALTAVLLMATMPAAAQSSTGLAVGTSDKVPNPEFTGTVEKAAHQLGTNNTTLDYQDDNGNWKTLNGSLANESNPVTLRADNLAFDAASQFPSESNSTLDASEWTTTSGTNSDVSVSSPDADVQTLSVDANVANTESVTMSFDGVSITSDVGKRVFWAAANIQTLNGTAELVIADSDGDEKRLHLNGSASANDADVLADGTGNGFVSQADVSGLAVEGSGDGTFDGIQSIKIIVNDGDLDADFTTLSTDRLSKVSYGVQHIDQDGDNTTENVTVYEPTGAYDVHSVDSLGAPFDNATVYGMEFDYVLDAADANNAEYEFADAEEYNYDSRFGVYYSYEFPDVQDLDLRNAQLTDTVTFPSSRLLSSQYIEGAGTSSYEDLEDSSAWVDLVADYEDAGHNGTVTVDDTIQQGVRYVVYQEWLVNDDDEDEMTTSGGIGGPIGGAADGFIGFLKSIPGILIAGVTGYGVLFKNWIGRVLSGLGIGG